MIEYIKEYIDRMSEDFEEVFEFNIFCAINYRKDI